MKWLKKLSPLIFLLPFGLVFIGLSKLETTQAASATAIFLGTVGLFLFIFYISGVISGITEGTRRNTILFWLLLPFLIIAAVVIGFLEGLLRKPKKAK